MLKTESENQNAESLKGRELLRAKSLIQNTEDQICNAKAESENWKCRNAEAEKLVVKCEIPLGRKGTLIPATPGLNIDRWINMLKTLISVHPILFYQVVAYESQFL